MCIKCYNVYGYPGRTLRRPDTIVNGRIRHKLINLGNDDIKEEIHSIEILEDSQEKQSKIFQLWQDTHPGRTLRRPDTIVNGRILPFYDVSDRKSP